MPTRMKAVYIAVMCGALIKSPALASVEKFAQKYQRTASQEKRLQLCVDALDHKLIRNGLKEASLENFFGADNVHEYDSRRTATVYLSNQWSWRLFFSINESGEISQITMTNMDPKHEPPLSSPSREVLNNFTKRYRSAKTEKGRLEICLDAIDKGVVCDGAPISNIQEVFGKNWKEEYIPERGNFASVSVSQKSNGWRLCFYYSGKNIISDYVTNSDNKVYPY